MSRNEIVSAEFDKLSNLLTENTQGYSSANAKDIYSKIYFLVYLSRRFETKSYFDSPYYRAMSSFLIEGLIALLKNVPNGSLLLLRSSIENQLKSILFLSQLNISERSYGENFKTLQIHLINNSFEIKKKKECIEILRRHYSKLSAISHSATSVNSYNIYEYYSDLINNTSLESCENSWLDVLDQMCRYSTYQCFDSFKNWEYFELCELLNLAFSKTFSRKLAEFFIDGKKF